MKNCVKKLEIPLSKKEVVVFSILILYLCAIYLIFIALNYLVPLIINNVIDLLTLLPTFYNYLIDLATNLEDQGVIEFIRLEELLTNLTADYSPDKLLLQWTQALTSLGAFTKGLSSLVLNFFLSVIISIYTLLFKDSILDFIGKLSSKVMSETVFNSSRRWIQTTNQIFYKFISSQFIDECQICYYARFAIRNL